MRRSNSNQVEAPGQDSFLDVICNLVGIMIVLVMVVAAHAKSVLVQGEAQKQAAATEPAIDVDGAQRAAHNVEVGIGELQGKIETQGMEIAYRNLERDQLQRLVLLAEEDLDKRRSQMSDEQKSQVDLERRLRGAEAELARMDLALEANVKPPPTTIPHLPTPMAKTVFTSEVHFRLLGGRLVYVPFNEMVERMQAEAPERAQRLKNAARIEETLPIVQGFGGRYILRRANVNVPSRLGPAQHTLVELERLWLVDAEDHLGEPFEAALEAGSQFRARLTGLDPKRNVITVWVYPDSFEHFRRLKEELFEAGFLAAARPLPNGVPIGGAPDGSRSLAE